MMKSAKKRTSGCQRKGSKKNVASVNKAILSDLLGNISKTAEQALRSKDPQDKARKLEKVCTLAKRAMDQSPSSITLKPKPKAAAPARSEKK